MSRSARISGIFGRLSEAVQAGCSVRRMPADFHHGLLAEEGAEEASHAIHDALQDAGRRGLRESRCGNRGRNGTGRRCGSGSEKGNRNRDAMGLGNRGGDGLASRRGCGDIGSRVHGHDSLARSLFDRGNRRGQRRRNHRGRRGPGYQRERRLGVDTSRGGRWLRIRRSRGPALRGHARSRDRAPFRQK